MYARDISCGGKYFNVYAPWTWEYTIEIYKHKALGNYVTLTQWDYMYVFAHTKSTVTGKVKGWDKIWTIDLSGITTWPHLHYEEWYKWDNIKYDNNNKYIVNTRSVNIRAYRWWTYEIYMTEYDLWDVNQNDASPWVWASGRDLQDKQKDNPIAITSDMRKVLWIKFWDKVELIARDGKRYTATVHDEMAKRYRDWCVKRPKTDICIKWDIARYNWVAPFPSGVYTVIKK